ncbi:MAG: hypothetical protein LBG24_00685 [Treponema sp.]|nr:hypothetical protein [Treponema sp.]
MQLLPCMGVVSRFILPVGWEALCVAGASMLYLDKPSKSLLMQVALMVSIAFGLSGIAKACLGYPPRKPGLVCTLVQGGYAIADYLLVQQHPVLGKKIIAHKYLGHIKERSITLQPSSIQRDGYKTSTANELPSCLWKLHTSPRESGQIPF